MSTQFVLVCNGMSSDATTGTTSCASQSWVNAYVVSPEQQAQLELLTQGGFDSDAFQFWFGATLTMFAVGFSVGIIISQLRKLRRG